MGLITHTHTRMSMTNNNNRTHALHTHTQDCIFMGLMRRAEEPDPSVVRLWVAPASGVILCADERFADNFGISHADVAGRAFSTLGPDMEALDG